MTRPTATAVAFALLALADPAGARAQLEPIGEGGEIITTPGIGDGGSWTDFLGSIGLGGLGIPGGGSTGAEGSSEGGADGVDEPIITAIRMFSIWQFKGGSNDQQRKTIQAHWATALAQEAEELLRSEMFQKILAFMEENRDLFREVYDAMRTARGSVAELDRLRRVGELQSEIVTLFTETAEILSEVESFDEDELTELSGLLDNLLAESGEAVATLLSVFDGSADVLLADDEKLGLLDDVERSLLAIRRTLTQVHRYVAFVELNRSSSAPALDLLFAPATTP